MNVAIATVVLRPNVITAAYKPSRRCLVSISSTSGINGKTFHDEQGLFAGIKNPLSVVRYHSLIVENSAKQSPLIVTATNKQGLIMGLRHMTLPIESVQFHPEAIKTEFGLKMISNFVSE